jgi:prevent-host-death family protein
MITVQLYDAKARLSQLLWYVETGDQVVITRRGVPVARLVPIENETKHEEKQK